MDNAIKIEIWSDIACPYCYLGKHYLRQALEQFEHRDAVEVIWRSYELDPDAGKESDRDIYDILASKYGRSREWAIQMNEDLKQRGKSVGIEINPDKIIRVNSHDAHRLIKYAAERNLAEEAQERLFAAYFTNGENIADHGTLIAIADEIGLNEEKVAGMLAGSEYGDQVRKDQRRARELGIGGVPFFLFMGKYVVSGAQPVELFLKALQTCHNPSDRLKQSDG